MNVPLSRDLLLINVAAFLRSFTFGLTGVVLGIYLFRIGLSSFSIGMVIGGGAKISYDVLLYRAFRKLRPPEER